jgi:GMP synthase (glutamine-hydrolysing)
VAATGARLVTVDVSERFLDALPVSPTPRASARSSAGVHPGLRGAVRDALGSNEAETEFLVQGTLYPDVVEPAGSRHGEHQEPHNVGGLPDDLKFKLVEPLRLLFKDEVRAVGRELGLPEEIVGRQPFPGRAGIRIVGEVTEDRLDTLRRADAIAPARN